MGTVESKPITDGAFDRPSGEYLEYARLDSKSFRFLLATEPGAGPFPVGNQPLRGSSCLGREAVDSQPALNRVGSREGRL